MTCKWHEIAAAHAHDEPEQRTNGCVWLRGWTFQWCILRNRDDLRRGRMKNRDPAMTQVRNAGFDLCWQVNLQSWGDFTVSLLLSHNDNCGVGMVNCNEIKHLLHCSTAALNQNDYYEFTLWTVKLTRICVFSGCFRVYCAVSYGLCSRIFSFFCTHLLLLIGAIFSKTALKEELR